MLVMDLTTQMSNGKLHLWTCLTIQITVIGRRGKCSCEAKNRLALGRKVAVVVKCLAWQKRVSVEAGTLRSVATHPVMKAAKRFPGT